MTSTIGPRKWYLFMMKSEYIHASMATLFNHVPFFAGRSFIKHQLHHWVHSDKSLDTSSASQNMRGFFFFISGYITQAIVISGQSNSVITKLWNYSTIIILSLVITFCCTLFFLWSYIFATPKYLRMIYTCFTYLKFRYVAFRLMC
jgi:hypothetical protein